MLNPCTKYWSDTARLKGLQFIVLIPHFKLRILPMKELLISLLWLRCVTPVCPPFLPHFCSRYTTFTKAHLGFYWALLQREQWWRLEEPTHHLHVTFMSPPQPMAGTTQGPCRHLVKEHLEADVGNMLPSQWQHHPSPALLEQPSITDTSCSSGRHLGTAAHCQHRMETGI